MSQNAELARHKMEWLRAKQRPARPADPAAKLQGYWELAKVG